jgi:hypothetical protein
MRVRVHISKNRGKEKNNDNTYTEAFMENGNTRTFISSIEFTSTQKAGAAKDYTLSQHKRYLRQPSLIPNQP